MKNLFVILFVFIFLYGCASKTFVSIDNAQNSDTQMCNYDRYLEKRPNSSYAGNEDVLIYELQKRGVSEQDCINLTGRKGIYSFLKDGKHEKQVL